MLAVSTRTHAFLHYLFALVLISAPVWGQFGGRNPESWVAIGVGAALLAFGLITDNELGLVKRLQMPMHLWLDALAGIVTATSPWVFSFDDRVWIPHLAAGVLLVVLAIGSHTIPGYDRRSSAGGSRG